MNKSYRCNITKFAFPRHWLSWRRGSTSLAVRLQLGGLRRALRLLRMHLLRCQQAAEQSY